MRRYAAVTDTTLRAAADAVRGAPLTVVPGRLPVAPRLTFGGGGASSLGRVSLGGANERVMDAVSEEEGHPIRIQAPHQCPDPQRCSVRRDDLQPHDAPGPEPRAGHDFRAMVADVHDLAGIALGPRFDHHGPRHPGPRMPASIPRLGVDHRLTPGNSRARIRMPWRRVLRDEATRNCQIAALVLLRCRDTVSGG